MQKEHRVQSHGHLGITQSNVSAQVFWISTFALATALGARIEIIQYPVPYTLQTFFVLLAGAFLGKWNGALSMFIYLGLGSVGLPVFAAGGAPGVLRLLGPTGGYLLAFPVAAFLIGYLVEKRTGFLSAVFSMSAGLLLIFLFGTIQLNYIVFNNWSESIRAGFLVFSWWDGVKLLAAAGLFHQLRPNRQKSVIS